MGIDFFNFQKNICDIKAEENPADHLPVPEGEVQWQFRGFATAFKMQKKGVGKELLAACVRHVKERGGKEPCHIASSATPLLNYCLHLTQVCSRIRGALFRFFQVASYGAERG